MVLKQIRRLTQALIISGAFNILLLTLFVYWIIKERPPTPYCEHKPPEVRAIAVEHTNSDLIVHFNTLSFEQLVVKLSSTQLVENGYTERDLALGCLIAFHHLDISRTTQPTQQRLIENISVYPGLSDEQFQAILKFVQTERWPLTSKGLFLRLQEGIPDPTLADAFTFTQEFLTIAMLFHRANVEVAKSELLQVLCDGSWELLTSFTEEQRQLQDLTPARRQYFLLEYIKQHSKHATYLILKTDREFATKKLDDQHVLAILELLSDKTPEAEEYALSLLTSPRSDAVWELAAIRLYDYQGETPPNKYQHHAALSRFVPEETIIEETKYLYVVEEGDSLWKIANKHNVMIEDIIESNDLDSDVLMPDTILEIPM